MRTPCVHAGHEQSSPPRPFGWISHVFCVAIQLGEHVSHAHGGSSGDKVCADARSLPMCLIRMNSMLEMNVLHENSSVIASMKTICGASVDAHAPSQAAHRRLAVDLGGPRQAQRSRAPAADNGRKVKTSLLLHQFISRCPARHPSN